VACTRKQNTSGRFYSKVVRADTGPVLRCQVWCVDVQVVNGVVFPAHRLLLCSQSPRLAQMLQQAEVNPRKPLDCKWVLHLQDVYPDCLKLLLEYIYGCLQSIPTAAAPALFTASSRYTKRVSPCKSGAVAYSFRQSFDCHCNNFCAGSCCC